MNTQVVLESSHSVAVAPLTAIEIKAHVQRIQQVMKAVMKDTVHYGKIPGAGDRKSLFKPGAETLCATFRIAPGYRVEDLSDHDCMRYRVACVGTHQTTGQILGEGMGEASSNEEKYKWRNAVCQEEFDEAPEDRRRVKWQKGWFNRETGEEKPATKRLMVRTEPADIANTVLKMACKRAQVAMVINVTAASDIFSQDLEDLPEGVLDGDGNRGNQGNGYRSGNGNGRSTKPQTNAPQARSNGGSGGGGKVTQKQVAFLFRKMEDHSVSAAQFIEHFAIKEVADLPFEKMDAALKWIPTASQGDDSGQDDEREAGARG